MTDADLLALCCFEEANLEPDDGLGAVARVVLNRMKLKFQSDGTMSGTVLHGNGTAFSWAGFAMEDGRYERVANGPQQIAIRVQDLLAQAKFYTRAWGRAVVISEAVQSGTYEGAAYHELTDDTVLYLNKAIASAPWATADKEVCQIGHHTFYRA